MGYEPTPEQLAQAEQKRLKRLEKKSQQKQRQESSVPLFLQRPWIQLQQPDHSRIVKIMTWNVRIDIYLAVIPSQYTLAVARSVSRSCVAYFHPHNQVPMNRRFGTLSNQRQSP